MRNGIHFISGLPRSGSTLLSAILRQNQKLHANISSGVGALVTSTLRDMSQGNESAPFFDDARKLAVLRGAIEGYYHDVHPERTVIDTNRMWCSKLSLMDRLYPDARVICCVRDMEWVYDSVESLIQRNALDLSKIFGFEAGGTCYDRFEQLNRSSGMIGFAWAALRQGFFGPHASKMMLLTYETLTERPARAMQEVYRFLGLPEYRHDFDNIDFQVEMVHAFDTSLGTPGLHSVGGKVEARKRMPVLPPDLFDRASNDSFWKRKDLINPHNVKII